MHREQQILEALQTALQGQSSLGIAPENIFINRSLSLAEDQGEMPAETINVSDDVPVSDLGNDNIAVIDSLLTVEFQSFAKASTEREVREALSNHRRYTHAAIMADQTLDLSFVSGARYAGADEPEIDTTGDFVIGSRISRWIFVYRMNFADPGD